MDPNNPFYFQTMLNSPNDPTSPVSPQSSTHVPSPSPPTPNHAIFTYNPYMNPYMTQDPSLLYTTMYPDFSTQCAIGGSGQSSAGATKKKKKKKGTQTRVSWTVDTDKILVSAYTNTSKDSIVGTDQSAECFWNKVASYYNEYTPEASNRDAKSCKNRWHTVNGQVSKFVGAFAQAAARKKSGESDSDVLLAAHKIYENDHGKKFNLEHAWYMLKEDPKWMLLLDGITSKRTRLNELGNYSSSSSAGPPSTPSTPSTPGTPSTPPMVISDGEPTLGMPILIRPIGAKAAKRKAREKAKEPVEEAPTGPLQYEFMSKFMQTQTSLAQAMTDTARVKKIAVYARLAGNVNLTEAEKRLLALLESELFP